MRTVAIVGAFGLALAACQPAAQTPASASLSAASQAATSPAAAPASAADAGPGEAFAEAVNRFDPASNRFVWLLPEGVHGEAPWTMNVTVKHKGEVKYETKIALAPEIVPAGTYREFPAGSQAIRVKDGGSWRAQMAEVETVITALIDQFGRGDGEMVMETPLNTALDERGKQLYCAQKKDPLIEVYFEELGPAPRLTRLDMGPMVIFFRHEVLEDCPN